MRSARRAVVLPFLFASSLALGHRAPEQERSVVAVLRFDNNTGDAPDHGEHGVV